MRTCSAFAVAVALLTAATPWRNQYAVNTPASVACRARSGPADGFRYYITALDTATSLDGSGKRRFWYLPSVAASEIYFVSDSVACERAARAHASTISADTANPAPVHLLRVGATRYITFNFTSVGEWFHYVILDSSFAVVGTRGS
jgi:hypothetical protein